MLDNKEENKLYMYFFKDGIKYSKSIPLGGDNKEMMNGAKKMAISAVLNWAKANGDLDEIFKKHKERFLGKLYGRT